MRLSAVSAYDGATERLQYLKTFLRDINTKNESVKIYFCFCQKISKLYFQFDKNCIRMHKNEMNLQKCICASTAIGIAIKTAFL